MMNKAELIAAITNGSGAKRPSEEALKQVMDLLSFARGEPNTLFYSRERGTMVLLEPSAPSHLLSHLLLEAASKNDLQGVLHFLNKGVPVEVKDSLGYTALMLAAKNGHIDIVNVLLRAGAKIDNTNKGGTTALLWAMQQGHIDVMRTLLAHGANIKANGNDAVAVRIASNSLIILHATLNAGLAVNARDRHQYTSLLYAAWQGSIEIVRMLLDAGADIEAQDLSGDTALITACRYGRTDIVKELLARGANKDVKNLARSTALMTAKQYHRDKIIYILKNFGTFQYRLHNIEFDEIKLGEEDQEIYASLRDPISLEIMNDPIAVSSGITYDRQSLSDWFESKKNTLTQNIPATVPCPMTKLPIQRCELNNKTHIITKGVIHHFVLRQEALFANPLQASSSDKVASSKTIEKKQNTLDIWQQIARLKDRGYATHAQIRAIFPEASEIDFSTIFDMFPEIKIFEHDPTEDDLVLLALPMEEVSDDIIEAARVIASVDNQPVRMAQIGFFVQPSAADHYAGSSAQLSNNG